MTALLQIDRQPAMLKNGSFSGHETFPFRYAWLKKGIDGLQRRPDIFTQEDAMVELGIGKNMVRAVRHWCLATQVVEEGEFLPNTRTRVLSPTVVGRSLFIEPAWDAYLEDDGSLWLLHWLLANNAERATTWYWAFNIMKEQEFTRDSLNTGLERLVATHNWNRIAPASLKSDLACFLRTYVPGKRGPTSTNEETLDCPLTNLDIITDLGDSRYRFNNGPKSGLPLAVFLYALLDFWNIWHPNQETLNLREIIFGEGSPGRIFKLDDDAVLSYCDDISQATDGRLVFSDTVLMRQIIRRAHIAKEEVLDAYYRQ